MHCYCRRLVFDTFKDRDEFAKALAHQFPDGEKYCEEWWPKYVMDNFVIIAVPLVIIVVNFISKTILRRITKFEKR